MYSLWWLLLTSQYSRMALPCCEGEGMHTKRFVLRKASVTCDDGLVIFW